MSKVKYTYSISGIATYSSEYADCIEATVKLDYDCVVVNMYEKPQHIVARSTKVFWHNLDKTNPLGSLKLAHRFAHLWILLNAKESK